MLAENERIKTKSDLDRFLQTELRNYGVDNNVITKMKAMMGIRESDILVKHIILLRKSEYYLNSGKRIRANLYKLFLRKLQNKYALHIPLNCCGEGLRIMHLGSVLINEKASIGRNCAFHINTAVVAGGGGSSGIPVLKDGVVLGIGSVVLGDIIVEENVAVGANAVVNKSVLQKNVTIAGVPAKIVSKHGRLDWNK